MEDTQEFVFLFCIRMRGCYSACWKIPQKKVRKKVLITAI
jgi:hypothetical protein